MGTDLFSTNSNYYLEVDAEVISQSIEGKYSTIHWWVKVFKTSGSGYMSTTGEGNSGWADSNIGIDKDLWNDPDLAYDFQNGSETGSWIFAEGNLNVPHNLDGTGEYSVSGEMILVNLGTASADTGMRALSPHPRARIKVDGIWREAIPYVKVDGIWKPAQPYVKVDGIWRQTN